MREIRMLRSTRRGLETWHGRDAVTLANERARERGTQTSTYTGAPVLDPTCEGGRVRFPSATRRNIAHVEGVPEIFVFYCARCKHAETKMQERAA